jgi:hypothetical protein
MLEQRWLLSGEGLQGSYFEAPNNLGFDKNGVIYSNPVGTRVDPKIDFITPGAGADRDPFGGGAFNNAFTGTNLRLTGTGLADDQYFAVRWEGTLNVPGTVGQAAENFTFFTRKDDGARLWVNGNLVLDHWNDTGAVVGPPGDVSTPVLLTPGTQVPIMLEYNQGNGAAGVGLYWQSDTIVPVRPSDSQPDFIPQSALNKTVTKPAAPTALSAPPPGVGPFQAELDWSDNANNEAYYRVEKSTDGGATWTTAVKVTPGATATGARTFVVGGLQPATTYKFRLTAENFASPASDPTTQIGPVTLTTAAGPVNSPGLIGQYFGTPSGTNFDRDIISSKPPFGLRVDPAIDFLDAAGGTGQEQGPFNGTFNGVNVQNNRLGGTALLGDQNFAARWEGQLVVTADSNYTFFTRSDDGVRLVVNGAVLIDNYATPRGTPGLPGDTSVPVHLAPGNYPILVEFNQGGGGAGVGLYWQSDASPTEAIIPSTNLRTTVALPTAADTLTASNPQGSTVDLSFQDHSNNEARFRIEGSTDGGTTWTALKYLPPHDGSSGTVTFTLGGLTLNTNYKFRVITYNEAGDAAIPASAVSSTINTGVPNVRGAIAQYVNNTTQNSNGEPNFNDPVTVTTIVPGPIDFAYGTGSPDPAIQGDDFSTRFSGIVHIVQAGTYTFRINTDDGGHLWVNGQAVSDYPGLHGAGNASVNTPITLPAGDIPFVFVQAERGGGADAHLFYTGPDSPTETLVPGAVNPTDPGLRATGTIPIAPSTPTGTAFPSSVTVNWNDLSLNEYGERLEVSADGGTTWTRAARFDVIANPGGAAAAQSVSVTGLIPNHSYKFRAIASNYIGDGTSNVLTISTLNVPPGTLTVTPTTPISGDTNLTTEGNLDWLHIGYPANPTTSHQKINVVGPRITVPTAVGGGVFTTYNTTGKTFTWTDAQPVITTNDVTKPGDPLVAIPGTPGDSPAGEGVVNAIDNNTATKYLSFTKLNTGFTVTPSMGSTLIGGITITSANDAPERDPASYQIFGSNDGGATFTAQPIAQGSIPIFTARFQKVSLTFTTPVTQTFTTYKVIFPTVANATAANSMQLSELELLQANAQENATATPNASSVTGNGKGFHLTVPAGTNSRRVRVYVGVDGGGSGVLTATLSDGSIAPVTATLTDSPVGPKFAMYQIDFASGLSNQTVGIDWVENGAGSVILSGASWIEYLAPAAPSGVATVATGKGRANVAWTDNSANETGFRIERAPDVAGAPGTFATVTTTAPNITQFVDSGLNEGTKYWYRVSGVNLAGATLQTGPAVSVTTRVITTATNAPGLKARFWNDEGANTHNSDNVNPPVKVRVDYNDPLAQNKLAIAQNWGNGSPDAAINVDNFSSQWDGKYIADYTGPTTFFTDTDDGGRFFLDLNQNGAFDYNLAAAGTTTPNGELIVNSWVDQGLGIDGVNNGRGIVVNLVAGQEYQMRFQQFEHGGGAGAFLYVQTPFSAQVFASPDSFETPIDLTPPKVTSVEVDRKLPATATYTSSEHVVVHFSETVGGSANAVTISQLLDGGNIGSVYTGPDVTWTYDAGSNSAIITLPIGDLPDGNYQLKLTASGISDSDGNALDGNGDNTGGDDFTYNFYILKGDTQAAYNGNFNGDRKISFIEYQRLELNYGKTATDRVSAAEGDFTHDGVIDDQDVKWFFDHNGNTLAPPAPSAPVGAPAPAPVPVTTTKKVTKPAPKPVAKPVSKPVLVTPPKTTFATKKIAGVKDLLSGH